MPGWCGAGRRAARRVPARRGRRHARAGASSWPPGRSTNAAKPWREADADVCEAIDFCEYYAAGAIDLERPHGVDVPGEENRFEYRAARRDGRDRPLEFPAGDPHRHDHRGAGHRQHRGHEAGRAVARHRRQADGDLSRSWSCPPGVLNYLPGPGEVVGAALVEHPDVAMIAFTGSRAVGLAINARAAAGLGHRQLEHVKHVIAEMGGKNAIIVDDDADLDEAVLGVVQSAFGYQGQKCSACSRAIVLDAVYDAFLRPAGRGDAQPEDRPGRRSRPRACRPGDRRTSRSTRIREYIEIGQHDGREVLAVDVGAAGRAKASTSARTSSPTCRPTRRLAQEEIFGPVLAVMRAADFDEALAHRQRHRLRPDRRHLLPQPGAPRARPPRIPRRQPVPQPRHHRRPGRPAAVRRLQAVGHRHQGRRAGLSAAVRRAADHHREHDAARLRAVGRVRGNRL